MGAANQTFFHDWTPLTFAVLTMMVTKVSLAGLVAQRLDSLVKQLGSCCAMLVVYVEQIILPQPWGSSSMQNFDYKILLSLLVVLCSIASFAVSTNYEKRVESRDRKIRQVFEMARHESVSDKRPMESGTASSS